MCSRSHNIENIKTSTSSYTNKNVITNRTYPANHGFINSKRAVGCTSKTMLSDAYTAIINDGLMGFSTYNINNQCLILFDNSEVIILERDMPYYKILYKNPYGKQRIFWVSYDVIKE